MRSRVCVRRRCLSRHHKLFLDNQIRRVIYLLPGRRMIWIIRRLSCVDLIRVNCFLNRRFKLYRFHRRESFIWRLAQLAYWCLFFYETWWGPILILHLGCDAHACGLCSVRVVVHLLWLITAPKLKQGIFFSLYLLISFLEGAANTALTVQPLHSWWISRPIAGRNRTDIEVEIFIIWLPCSVIASTVDCTAGSPRRQCTSTFLIMSRRVRRSLLATYL